MILTMVPHCYWMGVAARVVFHYGCPGFGRSPPLTDVDIVGMFLTVLGLPGHRNAINKQTISSEGNYRLP